MEAGSYRGMYFGLPTNLFNLAMVSCFAISTSLVPLYCGIKFVTLIVLRAVLYIYIYISTMY